MYSASDRLRRSTRAANGTGCGSHHEPETNRQHHRSDVTKGLDTNLLAYDASEDHQHPSAHKESGSRCWKTEVCLHDYLPDSYVSTAHLTPEPAADRSLSWVP